MSNVFSVFDARVVVSRRLLRQHVREERIGDFNSGLAACRTAERRIRELIERYGTASGRDLGAFDWYQAFAAWKLAIVLEGSYAKFLRGESTNPTHEFFGFMVDQLMERARRFAA